MLPPMRFRTVAAAAALLGALVILQTPSFNVVQAPASAASSAASPPPPPPCPQAPSVALHYSWVSVPRKPLRAALRAGRLDVSSLGAVGGRIGSAELAPLVNSSVPGEADCAWLCRQTPSRRCLAYIWHGRTAKCFLVAAEGRRRRGPPPPPLPPPPPPPMPSCAELAAHNQSSGGGAAGSPARRFVLVTSAARVGSNWVRSLLNQHPELHMEGAPRSPTHLDLHTPRRELPSVCGRISKKWNSIASP